MLPRSEKHGFAALCIEIERFASEGSQRKVGGLHPNFHANGSIGGWQRGWRGGCLPVELGKNDKVPKIDCAIPVQVKLRLVCPIAL